MSKGKPKEELKGAILVDGTHLGDMMNGPDWNDGCEGFNSEGEF